ncbi:hypothetical protein BO82DRAFT_325384 [Aspergillus uvarum CBS 121591]|uniref:DUF7624 domain-containing protein n=1 Tax=Aspergillus uvarum CBS 121591 TaxID=1448315 RepID=A0A319CNA0_9EURO|nr:hypothetical protein BO82DRAFT_325384 [Aspergillus uvarum CBS 121591]PYH86976.1 hypothetical protein BO82DRAFT_325384 [Aspergillus uvarum CBS 121591]
MLAKNHIDASDTTSGHDVGSSLVSNQDAGGHDGSPECDSECGCTPLDSRPPFTGLSREELKVRTASTQVNKGEAKSDEDEPPQSVIHAPAGFGDFVNGQVPSVSTLAPSSALKSYASHEIAQSSSGHDLTTILVIGPESPVSHSPSSTSAEHAEGRSERPTPRAQTRQEFGDPRLNSCTNTVDSRADAVSGEGTPWLSISRNEEIDALTAALAECWALCNSLAVLSTLHGERHGCYVNTQDEAWKLCWRLCQELYASQNNYHSSKVNPTLDICHDFCQSLFEAREKEDEVTDSILRVSFELNNHLYNTHDRNLPEAFRERTLEFYITLCHRLMKQRSLVSEAESPLGACWSFAEMLFTMRQNKRENKKPDEDLLGSAIHACWELCDVFREGWAQRSHRSSDRGTPRPSQATFQQAIEQVKGSQFIACDELLGQSKHPETPTTVFDDTATISPDEAPLQNIFVLGQGSIQASQTAWSSTSSAASGQSQSSEQTSSTKTITTLSGGLNLAVIKILVTKAAINSGYQRSGTQSFSSFVKSLSSDTFGSTPWQISLLKNYKKLVAFDPTFKCATPQARASALDVAQAVRLVAQGGQYPWLLDLYRLVFGFHTDEAINRKEIVLQV